MRSTAGGDVGGNASFLQQADIRLFASLKYPAFSAAALGASNFAGRSVMVGVTPEGGGRRRQASASGGLFRALLDRARGEITGCVPMEEQEEEDFGRRGFAPRVPLRA
jgi:hypothetical protein